MKKLVVVILFIGGVYATSFAQEKNRIIIKVDEIKSTTGTVEVALFNSEKEFLNKPFLSQAKNAVVGELEFEFKDIPNGDYSISIYHDVNENGELDKNFMGIPNEPYGISRDGKQMFGPPSYSDAKFTLDNTNARLTISLD
jgi:uncharacterized protein (DUF2141 family)